MTNDEVLPFTVDIARQGGKLLMHYFGGELTRTIKKHEKDFATEADVAVEKLLITAIQEAFPNDAIVGEESGALATNHSAAEYTWILDPLDGTYNFANGKQDFGVMIVRVHKNTPELAVIYNPAKDLLATAETGRGTQLNGKPVVVHRESTATPRLISFAMFGEFPLEQTVHQLTDMLKERNWYVDGLHSAAGNALSILQNTHDGQITNAFLPWDIIPLDLILREAGLTSTDLYGQPLTWRNTDRGSVIAPSGIHTELRALIDALPPESNRELNSHQKKGILK